MTLEAAGQWATVASPLVATTVFVVTIVLERRRAAAERYAAAVDRALAEVVRASTRAALPGITHFFGGGVTRPFEAVTTLVLCLPKRYTPVGIWLLEGAANLSVATYSIDRRMAQRHLATVVATLAGADRRSLRAASAYVNANPWPEVARGTDRSLSKWLAPMRALIAFAAWDPTFGKPVPEST